MLPQAHANVGDTGFGSRSAALAGAAAAWGSDGYAAYSNPASLGLGPDGEHRKLTLAYGWLLQDPNFKPIQNVTIENNYTSDRESTGNVDTGYRPAIGQVIGATALLNPEWMNLTGGITLYTPFDTLGFTDTGETYIPEYVLYRARTQRPQIEVGVGASPSERLHFGLGLHIAFGISANGTVFLQARSGSPSTMRVNASVKPKASAVAGWLLTSEVPQGRNGSWSIGQVLRTPNSADAELAFNSSARAFGDLAALDIRFAAESAIFYDPLTLESGLSWQHSPNKRFYAQLDIQAWRSFHSPALNIKAPEDTCDITGGGSCSNLIINPSSLPSLPMQNILIPRLAEEWTLDSVTLRAGYAYRQSIFAALPTGAGNFLDPPKHLLNVGAGWMLRDFLGSGREVALDVNLGYQQLLTQKIQKSPLNEKGEAATSKIGAPGYSAGGRVWSGGATLTMAI